jgi:hypothetical protein
MLGGANYLKKPYLSLQNIVDLFGGISWLYSFYTCINLPEHVKIK